MEATPRAAICAGAVTSLVAGAAAGLVDGLWSWAASTQFLPDVPGKLRLLLYLAAAYGLAAAVIGTVITAIAVAYLRLTRLGDLVGHARAEHARVRDRDPKDALAGLSLVIAGVPCVAGALLLAYQLWAPWLSVRPNLMLAIAAAMGLALAAAAVGVLITFALGRVVELALRELAVGRLGLALSSPRAPAIAGAVLLGIGGAIGVAVSWSTVRQLHLRGPAVVGVAAVFAAGFAPTGRRLAAPLARARGWKVGAIGGASIVALQATVILAGARGGVIKAAQAFTGLGGPIAIAVRSVGDLDGDGYSRFLGGGDCDDGDAAIHPEASEIPDDGVDQNCVAGDAHPRPRGLDELAFATPPASLPADFDVVMITIDTLRADHLGHYGYERDTSPNLDRLAAESAVFENGWAHAPSTRYSIPAILTGRLPLDVDYDTSLQGWPGLSPRATTLAEVLGPRGLRPAAILNYDYFQPNRRMNQGIADDDYDNDNRTLHKGVGKKGPAETRGSSSKQQTDKALAWITAHGDQRYFLWVHYYDPHFEYERHPETGAAGDFGDEPVDLYDGEIRWTDLQVGRLLDGLRARPRWDRTIVIVTGDHGEGFGEHGIDFHGYDLYAAQTKVPFVIRVPGQPGRRLEMPVAHVDLLPTLANLAGAPASAEMMGRSLVDVLGGAADGDQDRVVFQQLSYENHHEYRAAASQGCHVIYAISPITSWSIYDLDRDPLERRDIVDDPGRCGATRDALARWHDTAQIPAGAAEALLSGAPDVADPLDVAFGDAVTLLSVDLPATVKRGETLDVTWTWQARGRVGEGWKVFAHLDGPGHVNADHQPTRPLSWWRAGQYLRYTSKVTVPDDAPTGRYTLLAGLWRADGNQRMKARGDVELDRDAATVGSIEVVQ